MDGLIDVVGEIVDVTLDIGVATLVDDWSMVEVLVLVVMTVLYAVVVSVLSIVDGEEVISVVELKVLGAVVVVMVDEFASIVEV